MTDLELARFEIDFSIEQWLSMLPRTALVSVVIRDTTAPGALVLGNDVRLKQLLEKYFSEREFCDGRKNV